jgi:hypothetical protein
MWHTTTSIHSGMTCCDHCAYHLFFSFARQGGEPSITWHWHVHPYLSHFLSFSLTPIHICLASERPRNQDPTCTLRHPVSSPYLTLAHSPLSLSLRPVGIHILDGGQQTPPARVATPRSHCTLPLFGAHGREAIPGS